MKKTFIEVFKNEEKQVVLSSTFQDIDRQEVGDKISICDELYTVVSRGIPNFTPTNGNYLEGSIEILVEKYNENKFFTQVAYIISEIDTKSRFINLRDNNNLQLEIPFNTIPNPKLGDVVILDMSLLVSNNIREEK